MYFLSFLEAGKSQKLKILPIEKMTRFTCIVNAMMFTRFADDLANHSIQGSWFSMKMPSYPYMKTHCGDPRILQPCYLHNEISYTGKTASLSWIRAQGINSLGNSTGMSRSQQPLTHLGRVAHCMLASGMWSLVQMMVYCVFGAKPLSKPMLASC